VVRASFSARVAQVIVPVLLIARPELVALRQTQGDSEVAERVEGRASVRSWFDRYILSETLTLRQARDERRVERLTTSDGRQLEPAKAEAVAATILWGVPLPPAERTGDLPRGVQERLTEFRQRALAFRSALKAPPGATPLESGLFEKRVAIERVLFCLFPRKDIARLAAAYASDAEIAPEWEGASDPPRREAAFVDSVLRDLEQAWLAPYLHLIAGHRKLCASQLDGPDSETARKAMGDEARGQIAFARDLGQPLIRVAAEYLLRTDRCREP
jgi:hypothetical protein